MGVEDVPKRKSLSYGTACAIIVLVLIGGAAYSFVRDRNQRIMTANFNIAYPPPPRGWQPRHHGPETLFLYEEPTKGLLIRGAVNQMVSEINPTPDLDRDNLAKLMADNTVANMPGWTAEIKDIVQSQGTSFRLVRRTQQGHEIVTAFSVEGNTTLMISISARDKQTAQVDEHMGLFHDFISNVKLTKADSSKW